VDESLGEFGAGLGGQAQEGRVGQEGGLLLDGGGDVGVGVAVDVAPERGDGVEVAVALGVVKVAALALYDDKGGLVEPGLHGSEGVPDVVFVKLLQVDGVGV